MVNQSNKNQSRDIDAQFKVLDSQPDQVSEELERAVGHKYTLQDWKRKIANDGADVQELRKIVAGAEYNLQRQERFRGAENPIARSPQ